MHGILPKEIENRRSKIAFQTPEQRWLLGELKDGISESVSSSMRCSRYVNQASLVRILKSRDSRMSRWDCEFIWRCVNLEMWMRKFSL